MVLVIIVTCMGMLFWSVRTQELRTARWSTTPNGQYQKRVFARGMKYIGAFLVMYIPSIFAFFWFESNPSVAHYLLNFALPLQGVLNVLIYTNMFQLFKDGAASVSKSIRRSIRSSAIGRSLELTTLSSAADGGMTSLEETNEKFVREQTQ